MRLRTARLERACALAATCHWRGMVSLSFGLPLWLHHQEFPRLFLTGFPWPLSARARERTWLKRPSTAGRKSLAYSSLLTVYQCLPARPSLPY